MSRGRYDELLAMPIAGPEALMRNGFRMPPGIVMGHSYLTEDLPEGEAWFETRFPEYREEAYVRSRVERFLSRFSEGSEMFVAKSDGQFVSAPSHIENRDVYLLFSDAAHGNQFCSGFKAVTLESWNRERVLQELSEMAAEGAVVGPNWTPDLVGAELEPSALLRSIRIS